MRKTSRDEIGPAELRLRMLLANPPRRSSGLLSAESVVGPILLIILLLMYWNFIIWPVYHNGQTLAGFLFELATK